LLFGALSSGIMLYGISLLYGLSGSLEIEVVIQSVFANPTMLVWLSILFFSVGLLFKISLVPMHIWAPDVYEAAPTSVVTVFSIIPKLAALVFLYRVSEFVPIANAEWVKLLSLIAVVSMLVGNLSAFWQNNAKRMLAYSSIAHAGFLLIGVIVHTDTGLQSFLFYAVVYGIMNIAIFYFINLMEMNGLNKIQDYAGLGKKIPLLGVLILIVMISLTGLPPTGGFTAKLLVFTALWDYYSSSPNALVFWLFVLGLGNSIIALFYYLKIPYFMFFKTAVEPNEFEFSLFDKTFLSVLVFLILLLFFKADWLISIINNSNFVLFL
jgi:NADH-quinone oxidoreductase subunit N